jgi:tRNA pseudouridine38-40 synthase
VRTIHRCALESAPPERHLVVEGDGFLYNQVRIMAGTLLTVGRGQRKPEDVDIALAGADRQLAGATLSPEGLWLEWIRHLPRPPRTAPEAAAAAPAEAKTEQ